jgi:hypothetical protein
MPRRPIDFAVLKSRVKPIQVLELHGWEYRIHRGDLYRGPCPIAVCKSRHPRIFSVTDRLWHCHKCGRGGDSIALHQSLAGLPDALAAALDLCERLGISPVYL